MNRLRDSYKRVRRRLGRTAAGRRLKGVKASIDHRREIARSIRDADQLLIVAEKDVPYPNAPYFYAEWLTWVAEHDPELHSRIRLNRLPAELPAGTAVFHAWVQDPVRERNPALFAQLQLMEAQARRVRADVVHPAEVLSNSGRDVQCERLQRVGLRTPRVAPVGRRFAEDLGGLAVPLVVRRPWGHCDPLTLLDSEEAVATWSRDTAPKSGEWVASDYIDVRDDDGLYRKYRYVLFDDRGVCRHLIVSAHWEVRPKDRVLTDETIAEELRFVSAPCAHHDVFNAARRELEFDIAAFDYSFDRDGTLVVWEVNPYPDLSTPKGRPREYLGESMQRTNEALAAMYRDRLAAARPHVARAQRP